MYLLTRSIAFFKIFLLICLLGACNGTGIDDLSNDSPPGSDPGARNSPPVISLGPINPIDRANVPSTLDSIAISVTVEDADNNLDFVELIYDGQRLGEKLTSPPFEWPKSLFADFRPGVYSVTIVAWDTALARSEDKGSIEILANKSPEVSFVAPKANTILDYGADLDVVVAAIDDGPLASVELFLDKKSLGSKTAAPYQWLASEVPALSAMQAPGRRDLLVRAVDGAGVLAVAELSFTVNEKPVVAANNGKELWVEHCARCHGLNGEGAERKAISLPLKRVYTYNQVQYSPADLIAKQMPTDNLLNCDLDCAKAIVTYMQGDMATDRAAWLELKGRVGNVSAGRTIYVNQCLQCHGERLTGRADIKAPPLMPAKDGVRYLDPVDGYNTDLFTLITRRMPKSKQDECDAECTVDVIAYLKDRSANISDADRKAIGIFRGKPLYLEGCGSCHGNEGKRRGREIRQSSRNRQSLSQNVNRMVNKYGLYLECEGKEDKAECIDNVIIYIEEKILK